MESALWTTIPSMDGLAQWALANLALYGIPILGLMTYIGSLGIPFPVTLVVIAAGALVRQDVLDWRLAVLACLAGAALADNSEYLLGRLAGGWIKGRWGGKPAWQQAVTAINRQGWWAIVLTRFWLTPLAPAVNLVAGSRYSYARFLLFDLTGQLLWVLLYGGLGYMFGAQLEAVSQAVSNFTALSVGAAVLAAVGTLVLKLYKKSRQRKI